VKENVSKEFLSAAWQGIAFDWLSKLQKHLGAPYAVYESTNFLLLTGRSQNASKSVLTHISQIKMDVE
jgi:hypothetical protein